MIDLVPTRLYGNALRVYEGFSAECQQSWGDLMFAMTFSFPGWASTTDLLTDPTSTTVAAPPPTNLTFNSAGWRKETTGSGQESSFSRLLSNLSLGPLLRTRDNSQETPQIVVHSLCLYRVDEFESYANPGIVTRWIEVPLSNAQAVSKAAKEPILTIPAAEAIHYYVSFSFIINFGVLNVAGAHHVQKPSFSRVIYGAGVGSPCGVSPTRLRQTGGDRITLFLGDWNSGTRRWNDDPPAGEYTIRSHLEARIDRWPTDYRRKHVKSYGFITWRIQLS